MTRNWDFVTMADYRADISEIASQASKIISGMKDDVRDRERTLIAAVLAAGGKITIHDGHIYDADQAVLQIERNEAQDTVVLTARR